MIRGSLVTWILLAIVLQLFASTAFSQTTVPGTWPCADDAGNGIPQTMPPMAVTIAHNTAYNAPNGSLFEVALAKGGPTGMYIFGHFHGVHNDRFGYSEFYGQALVQDQSGYTYVMLPPLFAKVTGTFTKPQRHQHCGEQFLVPDDIVNQLNSAIKNGGKLKLVVMLARNRTDVGKQVAQHLGVTFRDDSVARLDSIAGVLDEKAKESSASRAPGFESESQSLSDAAHYMRQLANDVRDSTPQQTVSILDRASVPPHVAKLINPLQQASTISPIDLIVHGSASVDFPAVGAILGDSGSGGLSTYCSGILVAPNAVLTAAHCVIGKKSKIPVEVYFHHAGTYEVMLPFKPDINPEYVSVEPPNPHADLALIYLKDSVSGIIPAPFNDVAAIPQNASGLIIGFGWHSSANPLGPPDLLDPRPGIKVYAQVLSTPCTGSDADSFVCWTFDPSFAPLSGTTCLGDSGGPFVTEIGGQLRLAGITSVIYPTHSQPCRPGDRAADVNVLHFANWLNGELKHDHLPAAEGRDHYIPGLQAFSSSVTTSIRPIQIRLFGPDIPRWTMRDFEMPADYGSMRVGLNATESHAPLHLTVNQTNGNFVCAQDNDDTTEVCDIPAPKRGSKWRISVTGAPLQEYQIVVDTFSNYVPQHSP